MAEMPALARSTRCDERGAGKTITAQEVVRKRTSLATPTAIASARHGLFRRGMMRWILQTTSL